jgi:hypothetical protein
MPFRAVGDAVEGKARKVGDENLMIEKIDLGRPDQVVAKFLPLIVDSALDPVGSVQEVAMDLMLAISCGIRRISVAWPKMRRPTSKRMLFTSSLNSSRPSTTAA